MIRAIDWAAVEPDRPAVVTAAGAMSWRQLQQRTRDLVAQHAGLRRARVAVCLPATGEGLALLGALDELDADAFLLGVETAAESAAAIGGTLGLAAVLHWHDVRGWERLPDVDAGAALPGTGHSTVTILTSGTTGAPKAARHTWDSLMRPVRRGVPPGTWLLCYRPNLYAGLQVVLQALVPGGTLVAPGRDAGEVVRLAAEQAVQFASATPSYWRWLLMFAPREQLARIPLQQVTLGGEVVDQEVLDRLAATFRSARLVHIYATTELGRCFSVTDGKAGFPARFLDQVSSDGIELTVRDGELFVRSANAMQAYDQRSEPAPGGGTVDGWRATGDLVRVDGDRIHFTGRRSDLINVGGNKVQPVFVEQVVLGVPGVQDARVFARRSSLVGQLVACDVVPMAGHDGEAVLAAVKARCDAALQPHERPRFLQLTDHIQLSAAGKKLRTDAR